MSDAVTPPPLQGPTSKEKKYDRQLRLWAATGQSALEDAHILLINSGSGVAGVEALKNLVLPGIAPSRGSPSIQNELLILSAQVLAILQLSTQQLSPNRTLA